MLLHAKFSTICSSFCSLNERELSFNNCIFITFHFFSNCSLSLNQVIHAFLSKIKMNYFVSGMKSEVQMDVFISTSDIRVRDSSKSSLFSIVFQFLCKRSNAYLVLFPQPSTHTESCFDYLQFLMVYKCLRGKFYIHYML